MCRRRVMMETVFELCSGWSLPEVHLGPLDSLFLSLWRFHHFTSDIQHWCLQQRVNCGSDALVNGIQVGRVSIVQCVHFRSVQEVNVYALNQWPFTEWKVVNLIFNPTVRTPPWMSSLQRPLHRLLSLFTWSKSHWLWIVQQYITCSNCLFSVRMKTFSPTNSVFLLLRVSSS